MISPLEYHHTHTHTQKVCINSSSTGNDQKAANNKDMTAGGQYGTRHLCTLSLRHRLYFEALQERRVILAQPATEMRVCDHASEAVLKRCQKPQPRQRDVSALHDNTATLDVVAAAARKTPYC